MPFHQLFHSINGNFWSVSKSSCNKISFHDKCSAQIDGRDKISFRITYNAQELKVFFFCKCFGSKMFNILKKFVWHRCKHFSISLGGLFLCELNKRDCCYIWYFLCVFWTVFGWWFHYVYCYFGDDGVTMTMVAVLLLFICVCMMLAGYVDGIKTTTVLTIHRH